MEIKEIMSSIRTTRTYKGMPDRDLNNGWCAPFARKVIKAMRTLDMKPKFLCTYDFQYDITDPPYWKKATKMSSLFPDDEGDPMRWNLDNLKNYETTNDPDYSGIYLSYHAWVFFEGKHYDAEHPEGVDSFWDLSFFKRERGIYPEGTKSYIG